MDRFKAARNTGILGVLWNIFLLSIKITIGIISGSQAMIADSANSLGDIFASLMTFIGNKISNEPKDDDHNFGHGKAEYIFSLLISLSMILVALKLLFDSVLTLFNKEKFVFSWTLVIVCIITIIIKFFLYLYTNKLAKKYNNILISSSSKDHRNDCIVTTFTLFSILMSLANIYWFDGIVGIGISLWICFTGVKIFIESFNILMDSSIDEKTKTSILNLAKTYKEIKKVDKFSSAPVGYQYFITLTIFVDGNMNTTKSHNLADNLERKICKIEKIYGAIVHVEPF